MATFSQTRALTLGKYVAEQGVVMSNWLKTFQTCWSHSSLFALEKQAKFSELSLPQVDLLVATFKETHAPTSRKYVAEQGIVMQN